MKTEAVDKAAVKVRGRRHQFKKIQVIINPNAGPKGLEIPILDILEKTFGPTKTEWDAVLMHKHGDGKRLARKAIKAGCDMVAAYGGDGTVMEVASALQDTGIPMAILPGGTGNAMAGELGIPKDLQEAVNFIASGDYELKTVDMGVANHHKFIVRVAMGFEADFVKHTDEQLKKQVGSLAYAFAAINELRNVDRTLYEIKIDGESFEVEGVYCIIANSANVVIGKLRLSDKVNVSDGLLDLMILDNADLGTLVSVSSSILSGKDSTDNTILHHWQGRKIKVKNKKQPTVSVDGRFDTKLPVRAHILPGALKIVVPREQHSANGK